jgi:hypothetical protein
MAIGAEIPFGWSVRSRRAIDDRFITADLTTRDALSEFRRHKNLEVFVESTNRSYYLDNDTTNTDWMEVLKSIDVLTEDSAITDDDFLVWFDESEKTHKKVKKSDFGGSKWTDKTGDNIARIVGNVAFGDFNPAERIHLGGTDKIKINNFTIQGNDGSFATRFQGALNRRIVFNGEDGIGNLILFSDVNGAQLQFSTAHTLARRSLALFEMVTYNTFRVTGTESGSLTIIEFSNGGSAQESQVKIPNIPSTDPLIAGVLWSDSGTIKISAG